MAQPRFFLPRSPMPLRRGAKRRARMRSSLRLPILHSPLEIAAARCGRPPAPRLAGSADAARPQARPTTRLSRHRQSARGTLAKGPPPYSSLFSPPRLARDRPSRSVRPARSPMHARKPRRPPRVDQACAEPRQIHHTSSGLAARSRRSAARVLPLPASPVGWPRPRPPSPVRSPRLRRRSSFSGPAHARGVEATSFEPSRPDAGSSKVRGARRQDFAQLSNLWSLHPGAAGRVVVLVYEIENHRRHAERVAASSRKGGLA